MARPVARRRSPAAYAGSASTVRRLPPPAVYMVGGFIASGLAGYIRLLERPATKTVPQPEADSADTWDWIDAPDEPGVLARLTGITGRHGANILHLAVYRGEGDRSTVVLGVNSRNTEQLEADIVADGFRILYRLQNP